MVEVILLIFAAIYYFFSYCFFITYVGNEIDEMNLYLRMTLPIAAIVIAPIATSMILGIILGLKFKE